MMNKNKDKITKMCDLEPHEFAKYCPLNNNSTRQINEILQKIQEKELKYKKNHSKKHFNNISSISNDSISLISEYAEGCIIECCNKECKYEELDIIPYLKQKKRYSLNDNGFLNGNEQLQQLHIGFTTSTIKTCKNNMKNDKYKYICQDCVQSSDINLFDCHCWTWDSFYQDCNDDDVGRHCDAHNSGRIIRYYETKELVQFDGHCYDGYQGYSFSDCAVLIEDAYETISFCNICGNLRTNGEWETEIELRTCVHCDNAICYHCADKDKDNSWNFEDNDRDWNDISISALEDMYCGACFQKMKKTV